MISENTVDERIIQRADIKLRLNQMVMHHGSNAGDTQLNDDGATKEMMLKWIRVDANKILSSDSTDVVDVDLDKMLKYGAVKTAKENAVYEKLDNAKFQNAATLEEASSGSVFQFEGIDYRLLQKNKT